MRIKFPALVICLIVLFSLGGCDGGGNDGCTEIVNENNFMLAFQGCPNNGIKAVCNSFECEFIQRIDGPPPPPDPIGIINGEDCSRIDRCNNLDCDLFSDIGELEGEATLSTLEILQGNSFAGTANVNDTGPYDFICEIILP